MTAPTHPGQIVRVIGTGRIGITTSDVGKRTPGIGVIFPGVRYDVLKRVDQLEVLTGTLTVVAPGPAPEPEHREAGPIVYTTKGFVQLCKCGRPSYGQTPDDASAAHLAHVEGDEPPQERSWFVVEGDDHEQRLVEAASPLDATRIAENDFREQYGSYSASLLIVLGRFDSAEAAQARYPEAEE